MPAPVLSEPLVYDVIAPDAGAPEAPPVRPGAAASLPVEVRKHLLTGTSAVAMSVLLERGTGFIGNLLSARLGGASVFGTYSLGISTANNIATYAAGGIGATATRFSGKYPYESREYPEFARALIVVAAVSMLVAAAVLWCGAGPLAHLLRKPELTAYLRWSAVSAAGVIALECARGFFVGQRKIAAITLLSVTVGAGMLTLVPIAAHAGSATAMLVLQGCITGTAVLVCLAFRKRLGLTSAFTTRTHHGFRQMLREVWSFGFVQLAGMIGANLAGWWLTTLVARSDASLTQVGFFAIASQLRNLAGVAPGLLTEGSYAVMANPAHAEENTPHHVMAVCGFASLLVSLVIAAIGIIAAPWLLKAFYGHAYRGAATAISFALAIAVVHMANAPAAARLTIVSLRSTGVINTVWAIFVAVSATLLLLRRGSAAAGLAVLLGAHLLSSVMVLAVLHRRDYLPQGVTWTYLWGALGAVALSVLSVLRAIHPESSGTVSAAMALFAIVLVAVLLFAGRNHGWLPARASVMTLVRRSIGSMKRSSGGSHV